MSLPAAFLDEVRARTQLSALIGRTVKLTRAGREFKACCPFHSETTPSFTVSDDKGFAHCFGCGWHGDAFRWLTDGAGMGFLDAVRELAGAAGLELPAQSAETVAQARRADTVRSALDAAQAAFAAQLEAAGAVSEYLASRGVGGEEIAGFGLGYARGGDGSLRRLNIGQKIGVEAGLLARRSDGQGLREVFWERVTVPIHDHRGRLIGFGARTWKPSASTTPKFINSPEGPLFDKGRTLFNLHRAAESLRVNRTNVRPAGSMPPVSSLVIVEGYFDVIALARAGIRAAVAPMGTALSEAQLMRAWRVHRRPVLLFDGDAAGRKAARRVCEIALPLVRPGQELAVAMLPPDANGKPQDPDDLVRDLGPEAARAEIAVLLGEARGLSSFLFETVRDEWLGTIERAGADLDPEIYSAIWAQLATLAAGIADEETRAQYLGVWRARYERELSMVPQIAAGEPLHALIKADGDPRHDAAGGISGVDHEYAFPESESDSAARLIALVRHLLAKRAERKAITEEIGDALKMAEAIGFVKKEIAEVVRNIESDLAHGPAVREEAEMARVLYRRTLGIRGPMNQAMLPQVVDGRARPASATIRRRAMMNALIDANAVGV